MLFNGNLTALVSVIVKAQAIQTLEDQSSLSVESDSDCDGEKDFGAFCFHFVSPIKIRAAVPLQVSATNAHELIYTLHNLRI